MLQVAKVVMESNQQMRNESKQNTEMMAQLFEKNDKTVYSPPHRRSPYSLPLSVSTSPSRLPSSSVTPFASAVTLTENLHDSFQGS